MSWPLAKLDDVISFIRGVTFKPDDQVEPLSSDSTVVLRTKNVQVEGLDQSDLIAIPSELVKRKEQVLHEGDILISSANSWELVGKISYVPKLDYQATAGGFISIVRAKQRVIDSKYLYYWISSPSVQHKIRHCGRQTTNISNLDVGRFKDLEIPLPPLTEQKRISAILDKADAIRRKRQQAIQLADQFLRAVFLEMFGDPVTNPKGWPTAKFSDVGTLDRGKSKHRPRNDPALLGGTYPLIQTGEVANSKGYIKSFKSTYSELGVKQSRIWPEGTLCITIAANIAKTGILTFDACFPDSIVGFSPNQRTTVEYVQHWLGFLQKTLEANAPESAQKNINLAILRNLDIPLPTMDLQRKFSGLVQKIVKLSEKVDNSVLEQDNLFSATGKKAFSGKL